MVQSGRTVELAQVVDLGKAVAHPARLRILAMLRGGPLCVCQITAVLGLAASTVSGHLLDLRRGGLVREQKLGKWVEYRLADESRVLTVLEPMLALYETDERVLSDAALIARVRAVPLEAFCRAGASLEALDENAQPAAADAHAAARAVSREER